MKDPKSEIPGRPEDSVHFFYGKEMDERNRSKPQRAAIVNQAEVTWDFGLGMSCDP